MSDLSDYTETNLLDHLLGTAQYTYITPVYLGLFTAAPSDAGGGTEVTGFGYARQAITFASATSPGGVALNTAGPYVFTATGGGWGNITHAGIFTLSTVGELLMWTAVTNVTINENDSIQYDDGDITVTLA